MAGAEVLVVPLMAMVAERRDRSCRTTMWIASPVRVIVRAVNAMARCSSIASRRRDPDHEST
ncbi:hypothetical protein AVL61_07745 [Kocuria rosea subsp. polaris]|uniref:Uncharacterized protein n=1 Tax=Kocuria rosea subsp. polaris TaxID=136273 RepID=A0A0W8IMR1_KOCRO|nr:hypothetical protein AVL61_07745 [Kocuria polaris]